MDAFDEERIAMAQTGSGSGVEFDKSVNCPFQGSAFNFGLAVDSYKNPRKACALRGKPYRLRKPPHM